MEFACSNTWFVRLYMGQTVKIASKSFRKVVKRVQTTLLGKLMDPKSR